MSLFDIMGPIMVGPSSSHTAGAVKIGRMARKLLDEKPINASIALHGSFAATGVGHGTRQALIAGLLGMSPDDKRIPTSFSEAEREGLSFEFSAKQMKNVHPNSAEISLAGEHGSRLTVRAASVGGGRISIEQLDGVEVRFSGEQNTLVVYNEDRPGCVGSVAKALSDAGINIADMTLFRQKRGGRAVMIIETDRPIGMDTVSFIRELPSIIKAICCNIEES